MMKFTRTLLPAMLVTALAGYAAIQTFGSPDRLKTTNQKQSAAVWSASKSLPTKTEIQSEAAKACAVPSRAEAEGNWETIFSEDFSKMTLGTENKWDSIMHPAEYFSTGSDILPDSLFDENGWNGLGVYQAGGNCALAYPKMGGRLNSRMMNLQGRLKITARYKTVGGKGNQLFALNVLCGGYDYPRAAFDDGRNGSFTFLTEEEGWQELEWVAINPYDGNDTFLQFNAMMYNSGAIIIDYLKIERDKDFVSVPNNTMATKFVNDGFTASWSPVPNAKEYHLDLYRIHEIDDKKVESEAKLDNVSTSATPELGEGWSASISGDNDGNLFSTVDPFKGEKTVLLSSEDDYIEYDAGNRRITTLKFAVKRIHKADGSEAVWRVEFYDNDKLLSKWNSKTSSEWYDYDIEDFEGLAPGSFTKVRFTLDGVTTGEDGKRDVYGLGEACVTTTPLTETSCIQKDTNTDKTSFAFTGLDMNDTYYYQVKAVREDGKESELSKTVYAYGVSAPTVLAADNIDPRGAYTAKWEPAPQSTSYIINSFKVNEVAEDKQAAPIFTETFSNSTEGTPEEPVMLENTTPASLDQYADNIGWTGLYNTIADGMAGVAYGTDYDGNPLFMTSPYFDASNDGGNFKVTVDFYSFMEGDVFVVQDNHGAYSSYEVKEPGMQHAEFEFADGSPLTALMFYSALANPWLIDKVVITQDLKAGDKRFAFLSQEAAEDATSHRINGLEPDDDAKFAFTVISVFDKFGRYHVSSESKPFILSLEQYGVEGIVTDGDGETEIYTLEGIRVAEPSENGVYILRQNGKSRKVFIRK